MKVMLRNIIMLLIMHGAFSMAFSQIPTAIDRDDLKSLLMSGNSDTTYVLNFWATWCSPCVAELQYFEKLHITSKDKMVKVILINLDFPNQLDKRVVPFIKERNLTADIYNMTDLDYNNWISIVDKSWSGAIPATLIFSKNKRKFLEGEISEDELFSYVNEILSE